MKVLIIHGGDKKDGCTGVALDEMIKVFSDEGIETELVFIGNKPIPDCMNCHYCREHGKCSCKYRRRSECCRYTADGTERYPEYRYG